MLSHSIPNIDSQGISYIFELSGEHESLPQAEIVGSLEAQGAEFTIEEEDFGVLVVRPRAMDIGEMKNRLALSHYISKHLFSCGAEELMKLTRPFEIGEGSFAVRARRIQRFHEQIDLKELEKIVADNVEGDWEVDLENPNNKIRVIISKRGHIGLAQAKINRSVFDERKVQKRPFFSPVSLHPRLARALVNLSRVKKGNRLFDPFCGTGGILIEAFLIGAKATGSDIDSRMVSGAKENLSSLNIDDVEIFQADVEEAKDSVGEVDVIATDPPYGKSATTNKEELESLYIRSFLTFSEILKEKGYLSIVLPEKELIVAGKKHFELIECHPFRVHRSLTRHFCVFKKG
ncbi:MAG: methyltransferase domain-containing protein [Methanomassiliicoccales archaeon]|nr:MAG: methyltransferase domain-containing protein [Methanomassiliicoccales archaeon]